MVNVNETFQNYDNTNLFPDNRLQYLYKQIDNCPRDVIIFPANYS